ncbi:MULTISPECIES: ABC transporter permease [Corynebacterium]|uniref:ABC transporter permease n=1 Tax=Corynebacterium TaxID=1716 RepID=UPI00191D9C3B|nr:MULTISPECIES: ABC transporter permease [Corynebacterium]MDH4659272.1 ABC transporter permease [Corynebacterium pyruviciproducens]QQU88387.1 ABC transporter permease [Corynebacterium glucuronolyticum]
MPSQTTRVKRKRSLTDYIEGQELVLIGVIVVLWIVMAFISPTFISGSSVFSIFYGVAPIAVMGVAMTAVMCTAGIDVSVGSTLAVVMAVVGRMLVSYDISAVAAILIAIAVGGILGALNGFLISFGRVPAMVLTFGTLNVFRFIALQVFGDTQIAGVPDTLGFIGGSTSASFLGIPNAMWLAVAIAVVVWIYMKHWVPGRHLYAIGNDAQAARLAGVKVQRRIFGVYVASGIAAGIAGVIMVGSGGLIQQNVGVGLEMSVIAACVIGGTSVIGGRGTVFGTVLGAILVGSVQASVTHLHWPNPLTQLIVGTIIIIAVGVDLARQKRRNRP